MSIGRLIIVITAISLVSGAACATQAPAQPQVPATQDAMSDYLLGPEDQVRVWALGIEEISDKPVRIDSNGYLDLPMIGRVRAAGLSVEQLKAQLTERLTKEVRIPRLSVEVVEFGSQPVSVLGAVTTPGVHQLRGRKSLVEMLSLAGGLRPDAGHAIKISRSVEWGKIPLPSATLDSTGEFTVAELKIKDVLEAKNPADNILIRPYDVITVPTAEMVYVMGAVRKPGAFTLHEQENVSVLQALSMAEGLGTTPSPQKSKILRTPKGSSQRVEIAVDLKRVLAGKAADMALQPNDILFVPTSASKKAAARALEAAIATGTGIVIWRR